MHGFFFLTAGACIGGGELDHEEVRELLNLEGLDSSDKHVERLFERYDGDNSGTISRAEFEPFLNGRCSDTAALPRPARLPFAFSFAMSTGLLSY